MLIAKAPLIFVSADRSYRSSFYFQIIMLSKSINLNQTNTEQLRKSIAGYFIETFDCYESLFECLASDDAFYTKSISLRHPLIFYYGHTATFFINKLLLAGLIKERVNPHLESVFAVGVDEMSWDDLDDKNYDWPTVSEVKLYRDRIRALVLNVIQTAPLNPPVNWQNPWWAILMGIEHERIHLETSSVLIRQHDLSLVRSHDKWLSTEVDHDLIDNRLIPLASGNVDLSKSKDYPYYGWDNEFGSHRATVPAFRAAKYLTSNAEFLSFVESGGYEIDSYWEEEGLSWRSYANAQFPTFWVLKNRQWFLRTMTQLVPMRWSWPVEVNYHEAKAFCNWKSSTTNENVRLPTEDEWHRLAAISAVDKDVVERYDSNMQLTCASSCPVDTYQQGAFYDVVGNVWQWTETTIYPFEGFEVHPIYDDFTTPTFDGKHNLLKGGSWISCGNEALQTSRYAFRKHFFQHAGFRYVIGESVEQANEAYYETDALTSQYAEFHFGKPYLNTANFSKTLVELSRSLFASSPMNKALDLGCATGRASFELARDFASVTGIDFSARFIANAVKLKHNGRFTYTLPVEGELVEYKTASLEDAGLGDVAERVNFYQGDASNLKSVFTGYDLVLCANLIDRLDKPAEFLQNIHHRINVGGLLVIASPYTWLTDHTSKEHWLGGFKKDGETYESLQALRDILGAQFDEAKSPVDVPFVIRETARKYQYVFSQVTFWRKQG